MIHKTLSILTALTILIPFTYAITDTTSLSPTEIQTKNPAYAYAKIRDVQNQDDIKWRKTTQNQDQSETNWNPFSNQTQFTSDTEIHTGNKGTLELQFSEGSQLKINPQSTISLQSLHDTQNQPLIWINLTSGSITIKMAPYNDYRSLSVFTPSAVIIPGSEDQLEQNTPLSENELPLFTVMYDPFQIVSQNQSQTTFLTTIRVINGIVMVQFENQNHQSIHLTTQEQISFNESTLGPIVLLGAPPTLVEPKELRYRKLDLGSMEICEKAEIQNASEICGSWRWNKEKQYFEATWQNKKTSLIKVEKMSGGEIILNTINVESLEQGPSATYIGRDQGTEMQGDVAIQVLGGTVTWNDQGKITKGTWKARSSYFLNLDE